MNLKSVRVINSIKLFLKKNFHIFIFILSISVSFLFYKSLLLPIFDNRLEFSSGDFSSIISANSGEIRKNIVFYTFNDREGRASYDRNRAFLLESIDLLTSYLNISHAQIASILIIISLFLGIFGIYRLIRFFKKGEIDIILLLLPITLFYFLNFWSVHRIGHVLIWTTYAVLPLFLSFGISYIYEKRTKFLIIYSVLLAFFGIIPHSLIYLLIFHIFLAIFFIFYKKDVRYLVYFSTFPLLLYFLLNFPTIILIISSGVSYPHPMTFDQLSMLSRYGELINAFTFSNSWWPKVDPKTIFENTPFRASAIGIFTFIFLLSIFSLKNNKNYIKFINILSILFILGLIFIAQGTNNSLFSRILHLIGKSNLIQLTATFREWGRISILIPMLLSLILITSFTQLQKKLKFIFFLILILLIGINILTSPILTYLDKIYSPVYVPSEYYELNENIQPKDKILWVNPSKAKSISGTTRAVWNIEKTPPNIYLSVGSTYAENYDLIRFMKVKEAPQKLLNNLNIKYIIKRTDILGASDFKVNYDCLSCRKLEYLTICENENNFTEFRIPSLVILVEEDPQKIYSIFLLNITNIASLTEKTDLSSIVLFDAISSNIIKNVLENKNITIILPFYSSYRHRPSDVWSKASTSDPLHGEWHPYLERFGIENWQSDYGKGLVFTWAPSQLISEKIKTSHEDILYRFDFEDSVNFSILSPKFLNYSFSENAIEGKNSLQIKIAKGDNWGWKIISTDYLPIKPDNWYQYVVWLSGKDVNGTHSKVIYYNETMNEIKSDFIFTGQSGTFGWKNFSSVFLSPTNAKYIKIQFWVWQNNETESYYWIDDIKVYDLTRYTKPNDLKIDFSIKESGNYKFFVRYFKNEKGGSVKIFLDNKEISLNTLDQLNKFVWKDLGDFYLEKGKHTLTIRNIKGFNAINFFTFIPQNELIKLEEDTKKFIQNKKIIYIFEGESDLYRERAEIEKDPKASNGRIINLLPDGKAWQELEIVKNGLYSFAFNLKGSFEFKIGNSTFQIKSDKLNFTYIGPIYLEEGKHLIEILPIANNKSFKWNFSTEEEIIEWKQTTPENQFNSLYKVLWDRNNISLKVELYNSTWGWKTINSPLIPIKYGEKYKFEFSIKAENGHSIHLKIMEFNSSKNLIGGIYALGIGDGNFDWKNISYEYEPKNASTTYLQLQIWHGHETKKQLPNIIWISNVTITGYSTNQLDVFWMYSVDSFESNIKLEDLFKVDEIPAEVKNYSKINPTLWKVQVNASKPFMLSFAESHDPLWEARIYKDGKLIEKVRSVPLYGVINGFWINETGNLDVVIRYTPQDWFEIGLVISAATFVACVGYLIYDWRRSKVKSFRSRIKKLSKPIFKLICM